MVGCGRCRPDRQAEKPVNGGSGASNNVSANAALSGTGIRKPSEANTSGRMYSSASGGNFATPSTTSASIWSTDSGQVMPSFSLDAITRCRCGRRSGRWPRKARAPSNTEEPSHTLWSIAPNSGVFPSVHWPL
jgi:hypothetical protein